MKTNQRSSNRNRLSNGRRTLNRNKQSNVSIKNRIGKSTIKPKGDLRQKLASKKSIKSPINKSPTNSKANSDVKSRLGLQSNTARLEALKEARAQLKASNTVSSFLNNYLTWITNVLFLFEFKKKENISKRFKITNFSN